MYKITSRFLEQESFRQKGHSGIDFAMDRGTELRSIKDGVVEKIVDYGNQNVGKGVLIKWEDGKTAIYGHLSKFSHFKAGDKVKAGDVVGYSGNSGHVVGANGGYHLHFGLKENGHFIDPSPYINDIQSMNVKQYVQQAPEVTQLKMNFMEYMQAHMNAVNDSLSQLNLHFITFLSQVKLHFISALPDNLVFFQVFEQITQFATAHASMLYDIIARIL